MRADCPLCGESSRLRFPENIRREEIGPYTYASRKKPELMHYGYYECLNCKHLFAIDEVDAEELAENYRAASFDSAVESRFAARTYAKIVRRVVGVSNGSLLDVGCGDGAFLAEALRAGFAGSAIGVEPSLAAVNAAGDSVKSFILPVPLEQFETAQTFDIVTFFQTIEHVQYPVEFLGRLRERVAHGGYLVIVGHDWTSIVNRLLGTSSPIFDIEHLQIFSQNSLKIALERAGATDVSIRSVWNTYPLSYWLKIAPEPARRAINVIPRWLTSRAVVSLPVGNQVAVAQFG
jgi:SAM-dependent methyltransferase